MHFSLLKIKLSANVTHIFYEKKLQGNLLSSTKMKCRNGSDNDINKQRIMIWFLKFFLTHNNKRKKRKITLNTPVFWRPRDNCFSHASLVLPSTSLSTRSDDRKCGTGPSWMIHRPWERQAVENTKRKKKENLDFFWTNWLITLLFN